MVKEIFRYNGTNIKDYQCATTDLTSVYPTNEDCDAGSKMAVIDETLHVVDHYVSFDGIYWNTL